MIISFGEAGSVPVRVETIAHNVRARYPDNHGNFPKTPFINRVGPGAINTTLPVSTIQSVFVKHNLPFEISDNAGTFLCNEIFYTLMHSPGTEEAKSIPRGFVHVPSFMARVKNKDGEIVIFDQQILQLVAENILTAAASN